MMQKKGEKERRRKPQNNCRDFEFELDITKLQPIIESKLPQSRRLHFAVLEGNAALPW